jgi:hypothetical protein
MAFVVGSAADALLESHPPATAAARFVFLAVATLVGMVVYLSVALLLRSPEPREFVRLLRQRRGRSRP